MTTPPFVRAALSYLNLLLLAAALALVIFGGAFINHEARDIVLVVLGALITNSKDSQAFFFGTSQSSSDKNDILKRRMNEHLDEYDIDIPEGE